MTAFANFRAASLTTALALVPACSTCNPQLLGPQADSVHGSIHDAWRAHAAATKTRDAQGLVQIYADDAVYVVEGQKPIVGKKALAAMESRGLEQGEIQNMRHHTDSLRVDGDLAWELGTIDATVQPKGQEPQTVTFHFVAMWKLGKDRAWRIGHLVGQVEATLVAPMK